MIFFRRYKSWSNERGQIIPMFAVFMVVMILFLGIAIDLGYAYVTKANLSKALDAAALKGMLNYSSVDNATKVAQSVFAANYQSSGRDSSTPVLQACAGPGTNCVYFTTDAKGHQQINVSATTTINTFFARIVPSLQTLTVSDTAQSTRANAFMTLVLDRSGSMQSNDGYQALPIAVQTFLSYFSDTLDQAALVSFASDATLDQTMEHPFTKDINNIVQGQFNGQGYNGATYALGGLLLAQTQENTNPPLNALKVVVFFTDGIANTIEDNLSCPGYPQVNYGGNAPSEGTGIWFMDPATGNTLPAGRNGCVITNGQTPPCCSATQFPSQQYGNFESFTTTNITNEAQYRMLQIANAMRTASPPVVIYSVGLGSVTNPTFLKQLANTTDSSSYNSSLPSGLYVAANDCPGPNCVPELQQAFQTVATDILLKLTQ